MATLHEIAREAGVSVNTVSRVLNGKLKGSYPAVVRKAERVRRIAVKHGYRPNAAARAMVTRRTQQVGVVVPNTPGKRYTHPVAYEVILGINEGLQKAGYVMCLARIDDIRADLADQSRVFGEHRIDGMIVLSSMPTDVEQQIESLIPRVVWCDSNVWRGTGCIRRDERRAGQLAGQAAVAAGYSQFLMMTYSTPNRDHYSTQERFEGVSDAVAAAGQKLQVVAEPGIGQTQDRRKIADRLDPRTVIICNSIYQAHALRSIAEECGRIPGRDFGLACCDDMHQLNRMWPGLARVSFDRYGMGLHAATMMIDLLEHGAEQCPSTLIDCHLIEGGTLKRKAVVDSAS
ncbi:MAG: LacI family DNA-binding transcriptional regulator [Phycisphaeraceae bacterium]